MNPTDQQKLFSALRGPLEYPSRELNDSADELAAYDLCNISPVVEEIERNACDRGRFALYLELPGAWLQV